MNLTIVMSDIRDWFSVLRSRILALVAPLVDAEPVPTDQPSREQLIEELLAIERRDRGEAAAYQSRLANIGKELQTAEQRVVRLHREINVEHGRRMAHGFERDARLNKIRAELAASCPVQVDAFLEKVHAEIDHLQRPQNVGPDVTDRLTNLRRVRQEAEALRTSPLPMADLLTALRHLEKSVPVAKEHTSSLVAAH